MISVLDLQHPRRFTLCVCVCVCVCVLVVVSFPIHSFDKSFVPYLVFLPLTVNSISMSPDCLFMKLIVATCSTPEYKVLIIIMSAVNAPKWEKLPF